MDKSDVCANLEKKEKIWKYISFALGAIIVIFCMLIWYGYTIVFNY